MFTEQSEGMMEDEDDPKATTAATSTFFFEFEQHPNPNDFSRIKR